MTKKSQIIPQHIAIIMDGNGRWAQKHAMGRISGHKKGAEAVRVVTRACRELGVRYLTLYAFSVDNWSRPITEVNALMRLLSEYLTSELMEMQQTGIRLNIIGNISRIKPSLQDKIHGVCKQTADNHDMVLTLALNYSGRDDITEAVKGLFADFQSGRYSWEDMTNELLGRYLSTADMPDPDLLIRTSGEYRLSNFLLWQSAYTEFYFTDVLWPDFGKAELLAAIEEFRKRERRFGKTSAQLGKGMTR
ncbi:MAG: isoprenyl transferase [Syntrophales bacterium]|jgi:undecaprenyl diphosphate synthase|nr:isoprenyl transferase [Syntrophales bacterium]NLN59481.1 isoprenyl transferase [Deltaproteobacteria bacterium]